jgi:hypothetical protein
MAFPPQMEDVWVMGKKNKKSAQALQTRQLRTVLRLPMHASKQAATDCTAQ